MKLLVFALQETNQKTESTWPVRYRASRVFRNLDLGLGHFKSIKDLFIAFYIWYSRWRLFWD